MGVSHSGSQYFLGVGGVFGVCWVWGGSSGLADPKFWPRGWGPVVGKMCPTYQNRPNTIQKTHFWLMGVTKIFSVCRRFSNRIFTIVLRDFRCFPRISQKIGKKMRGHAHISRARASFVKLISNAAQHVAIVISNSKSAGQMDISHLGSQYFLGVGGVCCGADFGRLFCLYPF